jgi:hypothetical protein
MSLAPAPSCSTHTAHVHENSAVSGVFYVRVPARSGAISFEVGPFQLSSVHQHASAHHGARIHSPQDPRVLTTAPESLPHRTLGAPARPLHAIGCTTTR